MKPYEAAKRLEKAVHEVAAKVSPETQWLPATLLRKVRNPKLDLDKLLGLKSRSGGRGGYVGSPIPERDRLLREFAATLPGTTKDKAQHIEAMARQGDPALDRIASIARIPGFRQLQRILS